MDWIESMNNAMEYIELHITDEVEHKKMEKCDVISIWRRIYTEWFPT